MKYLSTYLPIIIIGPRMVESWSSGQFSIGTGMVNYWSKDGAVLVLRMRNKIAGMAKGRHMKFS